MILHPLADRVRVQAHELAHDFEGFLWAEKPPADIPPYLEAPV